MNWSENQILLWDFTALLQKTRNSSFLKLKRASLSCVHMVPTVKQLRRCYNDPHLTGAAESSHLAWCQCSLKFLPFCYFQTWREPWQPGPYPMQRCYGWNQTARQCSARAADLDSTTAAGWAFLTGLLSPVTPCLPWVCSALRRTTGAKVKLMAQSNQQFVCSVSEPKMDGFVFRVFVFDVFRFSHSYLLSRPWRFEAESFLCEKPLLETNKKGWVLNLSIRLRFDISKGVYFLSVHA